jgi:LysR family hydrogen peroxide-inducible transcriptional activator
VLADVDGLVDAALGQGEPLAGTLRLGAIPTVAPYVLPGLLRGAAERHPRLRVVVQEAQTSSLLEGLRVNRVDVALLALPQKGFASRPLFDEPFLLVAPAGHALARKASVKKADLRRQPLLLLDDGHCLREQALSFCDGTGVTPVSDVRAASLATLVQLVAAGLGVTLLPGHRRGRRGAGGCGARRAALQQAGAAPHDRAGVAHDLTARGGVRAAGGDGIEAPAGRRRRARLIQRASFRIAANSGVVTGCTESRLPRCRSTILASAGSAASRSRVTGLAKVVT